MRKYFNLKFWGYSAERALKTIVQALFAAGVIGVGFEEPILGRGLPTGSYPKVPPVRTTEP